MQNCKQNISSFLMLTAGFLFAGCLMLSAQTGKPHNQVQIKIFENGKALTDTTFEVQDQIQDKELDALVKEFKNGDWDKEITADDEDFPDFNNDDFFAFHFDGPMHRFKGFEHQFDSLVNNCRKFAFGFNFSNDSLNNEFKTFEFSNDSLSAGMPQTFIYRHKKHDSDTAFYNGPHKKLRKKIIIDNFNNEKISSDTIRNDKDVIVIKKVFPHKQQIIIEKNNPDVKISKGKKGEVEIIIRDRDDEKDITI